MSIKNDPEFVDLLLRYGFEIAETERAYQRYSGRQSSSELQNYLLPKEKAELTYQYIYTYIDKYVQEEVAKQKAFDRLHHIYEKNDEAIKHFKKQESKISELQPDDAGSLKDIANESEDKEMQKALTVTISVDEDGYFYLIADKITNIELAYIEQLVLKELERIDPGTKYILDIEWQTGRRHCSFPETLRTIGYDIPLIILTIKCKKKNAATFTDGKLTFLDSLNVIKIYPPLMASFFYHASK